MAKEMAVFKTLLPWFSAIVVLHVAGCRSLSSIPDKAIVNKFAQIDSLLITADPESIEITDAAAIQRLRQLYEQGNWKPFIDTMPADVVAIRCMQGGNESFRLLFGAGWLIEWEYEKGGIRKSTLDKESIDWLCELTGRAESRTNAKRDSRTESDGNNMGPYP